MPTYDYICKPCDKQFEIFHSINDSRKDCPLCNQLTLERIIGAGSGIIFKGTGFYETDYKRSSSSAKPESHKSCSKPQCGC